MAKNDSRKATDDLIKALRNVFKKYSRSARINSWDRITTKEGEKIIHKIINNPSVPITTSRKLTFSKSFKEWIQYNIH